MLARAHRAEQCTRFYNGAVELVFKKSSVLPNPDGQQTKKSRACLLMGVVWVWRLSLARMKIKSRKLYATKKTQRTVLQQMVTNTKP